MVELSDWQLSRTYTSLRKRGSHSYAKVPSNTSGPDLRHVGPHTACGTSKQKRKAEMAT